MNKKTIFALTLCLLIAFSFGCTAKNGETQQNAEIKNTQENKNTATTPTEPATPAPVAPVKVDPATIYQLQAPQKGDTLAMMKTSMGDIKIRFFAKEAPKAVENFIELSKKGYYNNLTFHRVMKDFMIQGGDPMGNGTGGESIWKKDFEDEFSPNLHNFRGALSMANKGPNTNGSQFFIVQNGTMNDQILDFMRQNNFKQELINEYMTVGGTPWLDNKHTVFGQVTEGMDVVDKIAHTEADPETAKPVKDVKILSIEITEVK